MNLFADLTARGLIKDTSSPQVETLINGSCVFYCGFDPTAESLHIGSLLPLITIARLKQRGHKAIVILGNATSSIGDPSFKSQERVMLTEEVIAKNLQGIKSQIANILGSDTVFLENFSWFKEISFIDFLRDTGKAFTVNSMISKESVRSRLEDRDQGISFTEFSYMLLQAHDFKHLSVNHNCVLQIGGSDQWGNITAGIELVRKTTRKEVFGLTFPLMVKSDGNKFGKTEKGNVWLSPDRTTPFEFFQFFMNVAETDLENLFLKLSMKSISEISALMEEFKQHPSQRVAHKALAEEITRLVHGEEEWNKVASQVATIFGKQDVSSATADVVVSKEEVESTKLVDWLVKLNLSTSKSMARKEIQGQGIRVNQVKELNIDRLLSVSDAVKGKILISKGKSAHKIIEIKGEES